MDPEIRRFRLEDFLQDLKGHPMARYFRHSTSSHAFFPVPEDAWTGLKHNRSASLAELTKRVPPADYRTTGGN